MNLDYDEDDGQLAEMQAIDAAIADATALNERFENRAKADRAAEKAAKKDADRKAEKAKWGAADAATIQAEIDRLTNIPFTAKTTWNEESRRLEKIKTLLWFLRA